MGWQYPTGNTANGWSNPTYAYNGNTGDYANYLIPALSWSNYRELSINSLSCSKVQIYCSGQTSDIDQIEIDVYYSGAYHNIYSGALIQGSYQEYEIGSTQDVTGMRIHLYNKKSSASRSGYIHEAQFWEVSAATTYSKTINIDTLLQAISSKAVNIDSLMRDTDKTTVGIDALFKSHFNKIAAIEALLKNKDTQQITIDALLRYTDPLMADIDALIRDSSGPQVNLDTLIGTDIDIYRKIGDGEWEKINAAYSGIGQYDDDYDFQNGITYYYKIKWSSDPETADYFSNVVEVTYSEGAAQYTTTVDLNTLLKDTDTEAILLDVLIQISTSQTVDLDAFLKALGLSKTVTISALLRALGISETVLIDALVQALDSKTLTIDALIQKLGLDKTVLLDAIIGIAAQSIALDTLLRKGDTETVAADALVKATDYLTADLDALLEAIGSKAITLDLLLGALGTVETVTITALLQAIGSTSADLDALIQQAGTKTAAIDLLVRGVTSKTISLDTLVRGPASESIDVDALICGLASQDIDVDALIAAREMLQVDLDTKLKGSADITADLAAYLRAWGLIETIDLDLLVKAAGISKTALLDVLISEQSSRAVDVDALLKGESIATALLDAIIGGAGGSLTVALDIILFAPAPIQHYIIELHDSTGALVAILETAFGVSLIEAINEAPKLGFDVPGEEDKIDGVTRSHEFWLRDAKTDEVIEKFLLTLEKGSRG
jgi:hypothetical protein